MKQGGLDHFNSRNAISYGVILTLNQSLFMSHTCTFLRIDNCCHTSSSGSCTPCPSCRCFVGLFQMHSGKNSEDPQPQFSPQLHKPFPHLSHLPPHWQLEPQLQPDLAHPQSLFEQDLHLVVLGLSALAGSVIFR